MSVLLVGKPELSVGFSMHKIVSEQPNIDAWENRFGSDGDSQPRPTTGKTRSSSPPPPEPSSNDDPDQDYNCGNGMCARSQATSTTTCATMTSTISTSSSVVATTATTENSDRTDQPTAPGPETPLSPKPHANLVIPSVKTTTPTTIMDIAIRCTAPSCTCDGFHPSKPHIRSCDSCQHGWVAHALDKLGFRHLYGCHQVELVQASTAFDVASLMLYGTEALPIRLKILLDRLFSVLQRDEVVHVLHGFGWTYEDYMRGYILQNARGHVLERWTMPSREEEPLILQQFLRFGETKPIAQQLLLQDVPDQLHLPNLRNYSDSDFKRYIQRSSRVAPGIGSVAPFVPGPRPSKAVTPTSAATPAVSPLTPATYVSAPPSGQMPPQTAKANRPPSNVSSTASSSPTTSSPINSPLSSSPLNKLQNMQPYDFRRERHSPDTRLAGHPPMLSFPHQGPSPLRSPTTTSASIVNFSNQLANATSTSFMMSGNASRLLAPSDFSATDEGSDNDTDSGAINLSQHHSDISLGPGHHHPHLDSIFAAKKIRHLRKSANPMKRRWNPMMLSNLTTNPATGKKRVQCHVCLKTFCDRGALKIHFSAVHLREMHKCTVDGCNMMFSSRRSRNRHSANPNPKLHTPNLRRKISHHDGRSSLPYPLIPSSAGLMNFNNNGSSTLLPLPPSLHPSMSHEVESADRSIFINANNIKTEMVNNVPVSTMNESPNNKIGLQQLPNSDDSPQASKKARFDLNGEVSNDEEAGMDLTVVKNNPSENDAQKIVTPNKGVRKRKSFNPTKCTAASEDDDLQYVSTDDDDDSSSDTCVDDNGLLSKSDEFSSDLLEDDSKDEMMDGDKDSSSAHLPTSLSTVTPSSHIPSTSSFKFVIPSVTLPSQTLAPTVEKHESKTTSALSFAASNFRAELLTAKDTDNYTLDLSSKHRDPVIKPTPEVEDVSESPLRHLETLSLGAFTGLLNHTKSTFGQHLSSTTTPGISFHAPGLGLASSGPPPPAMSDHLNRGEKSPRITSEPPPISIPIPGCGGLSVGDSDTDGAIQMLPMYRDASMMSAVDVPVDKENPRRCIACGKIFQNHFGVKTHYQNVHLKLMHKCTVEGCNAAFPSKRSRDRHSANLNLHRKLLSTSAEKAHFFEKGLYPYQHPGNHLRDDYFSRIYDPQSLSLNFADFYPGRIPEGFLSSSPFGSPLGMTGPLSLMPNFHPAFMVPTSGSSLHDGGNTTVSLDGREDTPLSSISSTPSPGLRSPGSQSSSGKDRSRTSGRQPLSLDSELSPDNDGRYPCNFCQRLFADASHLKDHYEGTHLPSLVPCTSEDCHKVFLTKSDKDKHCSQHDHGIHRVRRESPSVS